MKDEENLATFQKAYLPQVQGYNEAKENVQKVHQDSHEFFVFAAKFQLEIPMKLSAPQEGLTNNFWPFDHCQEGCASGRSSFSGGR